MSGEFIVFQDLLQMYEQVMLRMPMLKQNQ
jgi:hypothetical protein